MIIFSTAAHAKTSPDYRAGYNDGCSSSKGHYTRSAYKYRHSRVYKMAWRKGKRICKKYKKPNRKIRHKTVARNGTKRCATEAPWVAFQRGWDDGYRSAKGRYISDSRGCAAYRRGWVSGYRSCACKDSRDKDKYTSGYYHGCMNSYGYGTEINNNDSSAYRRGWKQGLEDCSSADE